MRAPQQPSQQQLRCLELATLSGVLRRLSGPWWCGYEVPRVPHLGAPPDAPTVPSQAVAACIKRGWFNADGHDRAVMTRSGSDLYKAHLDKARLERVS